jgi:chloramphenicol-sensitive protein RarD
MNRLASGHRWVDLRWLPGRGWAMVTAAAVLIAANWGLFIYGVGIGRVVEVALGYYIGPLVNVVLGVLVLGERPRPWQWAALAIATTAVVLISTADGRVPWLGMGLAVSFGVYGLIKKTVPLSSTASLTAEGLVLGIPAVALVVACSWPAPAPSPGTVPVTWRSSWQRARSPPCPYCSTEPPRAGFL